MNDQAVAELSLAPGSDWYVRPEAEIEQGDILLEFRIIIPVARDGEYQFAGREANVIILTQSCDIPKPAQKNLIAAEVHDYQVLTSNGRNPHLRKTDYKRSLERGTAISDFLLPPSPDGELPWSLVSFRDIFVVPKELAVGSVDKALRLASPYKEYFSQSFARFVMRVGLPTTLHGFAS